MSFSRLFLLPLLLLSGCAGYHLGPVKPKLFTDIKKIAVQTFKNDTLEPRVEVLLANAIIKQIQQDGTYQVVDEKQADALFEGTLDSIVRKSARQVTGNVLQTREYTLTLRAHYRVINRASGAEIDHRTITGTTSFFVSGSNPTSADVNQDERQAIPIAAEDLAVRAVSQLSEGW
ncbi:MAG: hypothetical protein JWL59_1414 [Chthoniobacteraceae bacterium]|nr:hypothetical protein [Chthoniobacteraceae bacterium]